MNLVTLDFGNSHARATLFRHGELVAKSAAEEVASLLRSHGLTAGDVSGVLCQVKAYPEAWNALHQQGLLVDKIADYWRGEKFAGMPVHYARTLGEDRLVAAWYAFKKFPSPTLMIDAGSFLTLDVISAEGFLGGYILPGLGKQSDALAEGAQLSAQSFTNVEKELLRGDALPHTTAEALAAVALAYAGLVQKLIMRWGVSQVVLTGGDAATIASWLRQLETNLTLHLEPDWLPRALCEWHRRNISP